MKRTKISILVAMLMILMMAFACKGGGGGLPTPAGTIVENGGTIVLTVEPLEMAPPLQVVTPFP